MIGYITLGTNDLQRAASFYDALLAHFGAKRWLETERMIFWGAGRGTASVAVMTPYDQKAATPGNGAMVALNVDTPAKVDAVHKKALELGGRDEGAPGKRTDTFYGAYFRDLDGNKLAVFCMTPKATG
jgi:predicted lactoylglutathione lyase